MRTKKTKETNELLVYLENKSFPEITLQDLNKWIVFMRGRPLEEKIKIVSFKLREKMSKVHSKYINLAADQLSQGLVPAEYPGGYLLHSRQSIKGIKSTAL